MYNINHNKNLNTLEIQDSNGKVYGKIYLSSGASLQELTLNGKAIIQDLSPLTYDTTYASSILFPFANRIKDGSYSFNGQNYQFEVNQKEENNALHGLVYNKEFNVLEQIIKEDSATIVLEYREQNESNGFPYTYDIQVKYIFTKDSLSLNLFVKNTSTKAFPFTLGWHPYFISDNLHESVIKLDSNKIIRLGDRNITTGIENITPIESINIEDKKLDDCWILNSNKVIFNTPQYDLAFESSDTNNFLQVYTPPRLNTIAIEPTTGVSDSFNNKIGLQVLNANDTYEITWDLKITNN
ncbi:aldose 1-epimerase [uncultured Algibacter sp.]|uniref:aldose 1-epimerase n=1 Tax=uncultured Algibacter sp. TaxID=298659 RepID=UPI00262526F7|nr:aldose 1-epimerase [uncultured Algibacter sp.]